MKIIEGNIVDVKHKDVYPASIKIKDRKIVSIERNKNTYFNYILPGFVDAHVHIESSMLVPTGNCWNRRKTVLQKDKLSLIFSPSIRVKDYII